MVILNEWNRNFSLIVTPLGNQQVNLEECYFTELLPFIKRIWVIVAEWSISYQVLYVNKCVHGLRFNRFGGASAFYCVSIGRVRLVSSFRFLLIARLSFEILFTINALLIFMLPFL
jgi:hypothetical protein